MIKRGHFCKILRLVPDTMYAPCGFNQHLILFWQGYFNQVKNQEFYNRKKKERERSWQDESLGQLFNHPAPGTSGLQAEHNTENFGKPSTLECVPAFVWILHSSEMSQAYGQLGLQVSQSNPATALDHTLANTLYLGVLRLTRLQT